MNGARWWLVCYDVRDAKRLRKCARHMEGYGDRVQYSIFRCWMTERQKERLRWELTEMLQSEDDILIIPICSRCVSGMRTTHTITKEPDWPSQPPGHRVV